MEMKRILKKSEVNVEVCSVAISGELKKRIIEAKSQGIDINSMTRKFWTNVCNKLNSKSAKNHDRVIVKRK